MVYDQGGKKRNGSASARDGKKEGGCRRARPSCNAGEEEKGESERAFTSRGGRRRKGGGKIGCLPEKEGGGRNPGLDVGGEGNMSAVSFFELH